MSVGGHSLQDTTGVDEDVNIISEHHALRVLHLKLPLGCLLVPPRALDRVLQLDVPLTVVLVRHVMHVFVNLLRGGVVVWPVRIRSKAVGVVVRGNVTLAAGVPDRDEGTLDIVMDIHRRYGKFKAYLFSSQVPPRSEFRS